MTDEQMAEAQAEFAANFCAIPTDEEMEREAINAATATPPELRTREQWATLGFVYGPPIYAREA